MLGRTEDEIKGRSVLDAPAFERPATSRYWRSSEPACGSYHDESYYLRGDGDKIW